MKFFLVVNILLTFCFSSKCESYGLASTNPMQLVISAKTFHLNHNSDSSKIENQKVRPKRRIIAAFLCITLGPFGMHRLYLGTKPRVAAAYTLTLGGGLGIVPAIDLLHIIFSRDISRFKNNDDFIMWAK